MWGGHSFSFPFLPSLPPSFPLPSPFPSFSFSSFPFHSLSSSFFFFSFSPSTVNLQQELEACFLCPCYTEAKERPCQLSSLRLVRLASLPQHPSPCFQAHTSSPPVRSSCPWTEQSPHNPCHELSHLHLSQEEFISPDKALPGVSGTAGDRLCMQQHVTPAPGLGMGTRQSCHAVRTS